MKKTSTKATVEVCPGEKIESGFQLLVGLSEIHVPRMWVEEDDKEHHVRYSTCTDSTCSDVCVYRHVC